MRIKVNIGSALEAEAVGHGLIMMADIIRVGGWGALRARLDEEAQEDAEQDAREAEQDAREAEQAAAEHLARCFGLPTKSDADGALPTEPLIKTFKISPTDGIARTVVGPTANEIGAPGRAYFRRSDIPIVAGKETA